MFFGIILVLILLFFCVLLSLTFTYIAGALLPYRYASYHLLPKPEQWLLKGLVIYPSLVVLLMLAMMFTTPPKGSDAYVAYFTGAHAFLSAIGAAVALSLKKQHKAYIVWYWVNIVLGGVFFVLAAAAIFKFD